MLGEQFKAAAGYAADIHRDQTRKRLDTESGSAVPYIAHLFGVTSLVLEDGGDEDEAIAALLHDAVEDQGGQRRLDDIRERFGERVADIVEACSDAKPEDGQEKADWWERKTDYIQDLDQHGSDTARAVLRVSMADKLYNLRATVRDARRAEDKDDFWRLFKTGAAGQLWYYAALTEIYRRRCSDSVLLPELEALVVELADVALASA
jgi:(p)ppGpp synthase/HD superfamily hydrolase